MYKMTKQHTWRDLVLLESPSSDLPLATFLTLGCLSLWSSGGWLSAHISRMAPWYWSLDKGRNLVGFVGDFWLWTEERDLLDFGGDFWLLDEGRGLLDFFGDFLGFSFIFFIPNLAIPSPLRRKGNLLGWRALTWLSMGGAPGEVD